MANSPDTPIRKLPYGYPTLSEAGGDVKQALSDLTKNIALAHNTNVDLMQRIAASFVVTATDPLSMQVQVWPGALLNSGQIIEQGVQKSPVLMAPTISPRIDRIDLNGATGAVVYTKGSEAASPAAPSLPGGCYPLALIALVPGQKSIAQGQIVDKRVFGTVGTATPPPPPPPPPPSGTIVSPAWYVSPSGSDANNGSDATVPFKTLEAAQSAARGSTTKYVYLRAGTHNRTGTLNLTGQDNGLSFNFYPPDGINTAVVDGGNSVGTGFNVSGTSSSNGVTFSGIKFQHFTTFVILTDNSGQGLTVTGCDIGNSGSNIAGNVGASSMVALAAHSTCTNNYFHDTPTAALTFWAFNAGDSCDGTLIKNNVFLRCSNVENDSGALYGNMRFANETGGTVTIDSNYFKDTGPTTGSIATHNIYLDDDCSNCIMKNNVLGPLSNGAGGGSSQLYMNGGSKNLFTNNIVDLGPNNNIPLAGQGPGGTGGSIGFTPTGPNQVKNNIIINNFATATCGVSNFHSTGHIYSQENNGGAINFATWLNPWTTDMYHNYGGGNEDSSGEVISDAAAVHSDPKLSGYTYVLDPTSPALLAPATGISFVDITRTWGPTGFTIPLTGQPPSCPH